MPMTCARLWKCFIFVWLAATVQLAWAQGYPTKPIRMIVPAAPAGTTDILARIVAQKLSEAWGQSVIVENRPGAGGIVGTEALVRSAPDGYTLIMGNIGPNAINYSLYEKLPYKIDDLAPVALAATVPNVLVVPATLPVSTVAELVALAKAKPGQISYASAGTGQSQHLSGEMFKLPRGLDIAHIPYKGSGPAVTDLLAGQVSLMFDNLPTSIPHIRTGRLRALAVTSAVRVAQLPQVPTMIEAGFPGYEVNAWFGVLAPARTPEPVIGKLNAEIVRALRAPDVLERLSSLGAVGSDMTPQQFADFIRAEREKWAKVVKAANLKVD